MSDRTGEADAGGARAAGPSLRSARGARPPRGSPRGGGGEPGERRACDRGRGRGGAARRRGGFRARACPCTARARHDPGDVVGLAGTRGPGPARAVAARAAERTRGRLAHRGARFVGGLAGRGDRGPSLSQRLVGDVSTSHRAHAARVGPGQGEAWRAVGARGVGTALHPLAAKQTDLRAAVRGHPWQGSHQAPSTHARDGPAARRSRESRARAARPGAVPAGPRGGRQSRRSRRGQGPGALGHGPKDPEGAFGAAAQGPGRSARAHRGGHGRSVPGRKGG